MRLISSVLVLVATVLLCSCSNSLTPNPSEYDLLSRKSQTTLAAEEQNVLNALFEYRLQDYAQDEIFIVSEYTFSQPISEYWIEPNDTFPAPLIASFNSINTKSEYLGSTDLGIAYDYRFIDAQTHESLYDPNDPGIFWDRFIQKFPQSTHGIFTLSKIAFNHDSTRAIVGMINVYGPLGADGGYISLEKRCTGWSVLKYQVVWIAK